MASPGLGVIVHRDVAVLRVADPKVLDEIRAILPLDEYVFAVISPTELVVDPARIGELVGQLEAKGLAPMMKRAPR